MNNVKKIAMFAAILIVLGVIGSVITFNFKEPTSVTQAEEIDKTDITAIEILSNNERVEIIPSNEQTIKVELSGKSNDKKDKFQVEEKGNTLSIETESRDFKLFDFDFFTKSLTLTVALPEKVYESLKVEIDNGSLEAEDLNITDINAATENGRIALKNIGADTVQVNSSNGKIELDHVKGEITGKTNNGKISLVTESLDRALELDTDNGAINIQTEKEPTNAIFDVRVDNGSIKIFGNSNWDTVVGDGDNIIKLTTNNGSIRVEK
ncbi:hypothetical protein CIL03_00120 [Virgibacillus indicus]|uniref:DUF4097 domain-containing protein n=1 Tax=Virgibacillus indicus TaxID=2024554 RepID=A0A265NC26_9BACI|nr:DUF4097 family beta strand repeat-containing protein [Virgibacillus indicus]OZU89592.1 hypothetical protein CIL03_00120 [Virgibacillus indicus]